MAAKANGLLINGLLIDCGVKSETLKNSKGQGLKPWPFLCQVLMLEISERLEILALAEPIVLPRSRDKQGLRVHRIQMA